MAEESKVHRTIISIFCVLFFISLSRADVLIPYVDKNHLTSVTNIPTSCVVQDEDSIYWSVFVSKYFGFLEFWVSYSSDLKTWSKSYYTGVPVLMYEDYTFLFRDNKFKFLCSGKKRTKTPHYTRAAVDTAITEYIISKATLYGDKDTDGLTDLAEDMLWTDPTLSDTDDDGKADGYDRNPLAAPLSELSLAEKLHKHIIEQELYYFWTNQLIIVEHFQRPMEYEREAGLVLSLSSQECDDWVNTFGYGVPILTCSIEELSETLYKANFEFFFSPNDAWGYEANYRWEKFTRNWLLIQTLEEWYAE